MTELFNLKYCATCKTSKTIDNFHKSAFSCKDCANKRSRLWHSVRGNLDKRNKKTVERHKDKKKWAIDYKGGICVDCKQSFPTCVFDFHHLDESTKNENPSYFIRLSKERAMEELDKCVLLCSNCHRIRHFT